MSFNSAVLAYSVLEAVHQRWRPAGDSLLKAGSIGRIDSSLLVAIGTLQGRGAGSEGPI
jgi:hypothetical protein